MKSAIKLPSAHPTLASLVEATADVAAFTVDGVFFPNSNGNLVETVLPTTPMDEPVLISEYADLGDITLSKLLAADLINGFDTLRLQDGRKVQIIPMRATSFTPHLSGL